MKTVIQFRRLFQVLRNHIDCKIVVCVWRLVFSFTFYLHWCWSMFSNNHYYLLLLIGHMIVWLCFSSFLFCSQFSHDVQTPEKLDDQKKLSRESFTDAASRGAYAYVICMRQRVCFCRNIKKIVKLMHNNDVGSTDVHDSLMSTSIDQGLVERFLFLV